MILLVPNLHLGLVIKAYCMYSWMLSRLWEFVGPWIVSSLFLQFLGLALIWAKFFWGSFMNNCFNTFSLSISSWSSGLVSDLVRFGETHCTECPEGLEPTTTFISLI
jgi:hypothetical protein